MRQSSIIYNVGQKIFVLKFAKKQENWRKTEKEGGGGNGQETSDR